MFACWQVKGLEEPLSDVIIFCLRNVLSFSGLRSVPVGPLDFEAFSLRISLDSCFRHKRGVG
jgi:hypothetical protein